MIKIIFLLLMGGLKNVKDMNWKVHLTGESVSADNKASLAFVTEFYQFVTSEDYRPQQVLNCDERGLC